MWLTVANPNLMATEASMPCLTGFLLVRAEFDSPSYHRDTRPATRRAAAAPQHLFTVSVAYSIYILHVSQQTFKYSSILEESFIP